MNQSIAKLTEDQIDRIESSHKSEKVSAKEYGISTYSTNRIRNGLYRKSPWVPSPKQTKLPYPATTSRDSFCSAAQDLVGNMVGGWMSRNPISNQFGRDQFESAAWLAVLEAYNEFDITRNNDVTPFVISRIKWRLFDELNYLIGSQQGSGMKRSLWAGTAAIRKWVDKFRMENNRNPSIKEIQGEYPTTTAGVIIDLLVSTAHPFEDEDTLIENDMGVEKVVENKLLIDALCNWMAEHISERDANLFTAIKIRGEDTESIAKLNRLTHRRVNQIISRIMERMMERFGSIQF